MDLCEPNIERLLKAFRGEIPDRVPLVEVVVHSPTLEFVMGRNLAGGVSGTYTTTDVVRHEQAFADRMRKPHVLAEESAVLSTNTISPEDYVEFCRRASIETMVVCLSYTGQGGIGSRSRIRDWPDLERLIPPPDMDYVRRYLQRYISAAAGTNVGVAASVHSCFARTYEALGFENFALKLYDDLPFVKHVMEIFTQYAIAVAETVAEMDISFFWVMDDLADNSDLFVSPRVIEELWVPATERILAPIKSRKIPIAYHCDGNLKRVIPMAIRLGINAIHPIQANCNDIYELKKQYGDRICLIGNLDSAGVLAFGTPEEVIADTRQHIERLAPGGRYVLCSSHSITPAVKPENFMAVVQTLLRYGGYR